MAFKILGLFMQFLVDFVIYDFHEIINWHHAEVAGAMLAHGNGSVGRLLFAHNQDKRDFADFGVADFTSGFLVALVDGGADCMLIQHFADIFGIIQEFLADRQDDDLVGSKPQREVAGGMLQQHSHKAFH